MSVDVVPTPKFLLRLPPDLRAAYQALADREGRTLTNLIIYALRQWLAEHGQ